MKKLIIFLMALLLINTVYSATIQGEVYDFSLEKLENIIIEINTSPPQRQVAIDGSYSFEVSSGSYIIIARTIDNEALAREEITITGEGKYILDIIAFIELNELEDTDLDIDPGLDIEEKNKTGVIVIIIVVLLLVASLLFFIYKKKKKPEKEEPILDGDDLKKKVLNIITKEDGRTTQKEIRKQLPYSEAKISLVLTELESEGKIRKIKKGRSNVIILNK